MKHIKLTLGVIIFLIAMENGYSQDWPNLARFQEENAKLGVPDKNEDRVVLMGNSITEGWSNIHPAFFEGKPYINRGISGQTTPQMLIRFMQDVIELKPKVVVILAGINDIAGNTGPSSVKMINDNLTAMVLLAKSHDIKVVICSILPANYFPWNPEVKPADQVIEVNSYLADYAKKNQHTYVDYYQAMVDDTKGLKEDLGSDGVHPNKKGYQLMAPLLEAGIKSALNRKQ